MKRGLKFLLLADIGVTLAFGLLGPIYAIFVGDIGGDLLDASWAYFAFMISSGVAIYLMGKFEDKLKHKEKMITIGYALSALGALGYYFVYNQASLIVVQVILGLGEAVLVPAYDAMYSKYLSKKEEASDWASYESMGYIAGAFAAVLGGYLAYNFGFKTLFLVMFVFSLFSVGFSLFMFKKKKYLNS
jgi:MFS family permease